MSVAIVFETHATSTDNKAGIATGWLPGDVSEGGLLQAVELGERRRAGGFAAVFTSDLARAVRTAEIAFAGTEVPIHTDPRLRECNYGRLNGAPVAVLEQERPARVEGAFPGGESYRDVAARVGAFLTDLHPRFEGRRILVIGHAATRWSLDHLLAGASLAELVSAPFDWREGWSYVLPATGVRPHAESVTGMSRPPFGV